MNRLRIIGLLAWRNLWRNHRRTLIMLAAITVGAWAMIFMTALMRGMVNEMIRDGVRALPGHVQAHHAEYRADPSVSNLVPMAVTDIRAALDGAGVEEYAIRTRVPAIISSEYESRGVQFVGIDPAEELALEATGSEIVEGRALESVDDTGLVMGRRLAEKLETEVGKRVVVMSQDPENEVADRGFRLVGLYEAELPALEEQFVFTGLTTAQAMLRIGDQASEVAVGGSDFRDVDALTATVASALPDSEVLPWHGVDRYLGTMLDVMDGFVLVWVIVIFLALSFGLVNTLAMAVFERVREIGLMLALGMKPGNILWQIVLESAMLLAVGLAIGNALAFATVVPLRDGIDVSSVAQGMEMFGASSMLYPELYLSDVATANIVVLLLGAIASLFPAVRASRYEPVEAITKV